jgi:hypothetical protein
VDLTTPAAVPVRRRRASPLLQAGGGIYRLVPAIVDAVVSGWVLFIEILR